MQNGNGEEGRRATDMLPSDLTRIPLTIRMPGKRGGRVRGGEETNIARLHGLPWRAAVMETLIAHDEARGRNPMCMCVCVWAPWAGGGWPPAPHSTAAPMRGKHTAAMAALVKPKTIPW